MTKKIPVEKIDEFCDLMFRALDHAGLLPQRMGEASHAFEKYSRRLSGFLTRYDRAETAYDEWYTSALRGMHDSRRERVEPTFQAVRTWLTDEKHRSVFEGEGKKDNLNHLKRSLYGRVYSWLYPRRQLALTYVNIHKGNAAQFERTTIAQNFADDVIDVWEEFEEIVPASALNDAQQYLIDNRSYYKSWKASNDDKPENAGDLA